MSNDTISVRQLQDYWQYVEDLKVGEIRERYIGTRDMPPWEEICRDLCWDLYRVDDGYFSKKDIGHCGVYRLFGLSDDDKVIASAVINRVCGPDSSGTLYIGEFGWLNERLNQLRRSLHREDTHGASALWRQSTALRSKFPIEKLGVAVLSTGARTYKMIEEDLVRAYLNSFGDTPPLNCSF